MGWFGRITFPIDVFTRDWDILSVENLWRLLHIRYSPGFLSWPSMPVHNKFFYSGTTISPAMAQAAAVAGLAR